MGDTDGNDDTDDATCPGGVCVRAPGFIKAEKSGTFPDISTCSGFVISCKHYTGDPMGDYTGYRIGFGTQRAPEDLEPHRWSSGFKAPWSSTTSKFPSRPFRTTGTTRRARSS